MEENMQVVQTRKCLIHIICYFNFSSFLNFIHTKWTLCLIFDRLWDPKIYQLTFCCEQPAFYLFNIIDMSSSNIDTKSYGFLWTKNKSLKRFTINNLALNNKPSLSASSISQTISDFCPLYVDLKLFNLTSIQNEWFINQNIYTKLFFLQSKALAF